MSAVCDKGFRALCLVNGRIIVHHYQDNSLIEEGIRMEGVSEIQLRFRMKVPGGGNRMEEGIKINRHLFSYVECLR